jgi:hypothetical protein
VAKSVGPEFKPQYRNKKKKKRARERDHQFLPNVDVSLGAWISHTSLLGVCVDVAFLDNKSTICIIFL